MNAMDTATETAIVGMGRTGQSVASFLDARGEAWVGFDEKATPDRLRERVRVGPLDADMLDRFDRIVVSPGVNWNHPALAELRRRGRRLLGDLDLFAGHFEGKLIAVTGTNGKTTTVTLIATMLDTLPGGIESAGNIGRPMLDLLTAPTPPARVALELSSFQLERAAPVRPRWAALLNVQPDHADAHESPAAYRAAKERLFARQGEGDTAMLPAGEDWNALAETLAARGVRIRRFGDFDDGDAREDAGLARCDGEPCLYWRSPTGISAVPLSRLIVRGRHQWLNLAVAAQAAADFGVSDPVIREALTSFRGLPHRMQAVAHRAGREWFNDSKATNPAAAAGALGCFDEAIWICGGLLKGLSLGDLLPVAAKHAARMIVIGADSRPFETLATRAGIPCTRADTIEEAVAIASRIEPPRPVLLSPAAASQDQFRDYVERGARFEKAVLALPEHLQ
ncbi:MAG: UDP-N-acetylmuramoyl-L-alanine--D-glutamate ligase [Mariprofundaceae bacterium]